MLTETNKWTDETIPYICWDRGWTVRDIRERISRATGVERHRLIAWLMRELKTTEVWFFVKPSEVYREFDDIKRWLGPATELWTYLFGIWHELGKV